jgi:DNA-binding XRE family transcriptional regulator
VSPVRERDTAALALFADEMKAAREQRGWSQADLADQIPYSLSTISMLEALHRVPTRDLAISHQPRQGVRHPGDLRPAGGPPTGPACPRGPHES